MYVLTKNDLIKLSEKRDGWYVSLFMPTHQAGTETQQGPIRLKNLLSEAQERLLNLGLRTPEAREIIEPATRLVQDNQFWQQQSDGLAIFLSTNYLRYYRLPIDLKELVVISKRFHIKPLMPLLSGDGRFYLLAISQNRIRLLQGSRYSASEIELENAPDSLAQALRFDDPEKQLQFHTASGPAGGKSIRPAAFHGQGSIVQGDKVNILHYFHMVDDGLQQLLAGEQAPLLLAAVDYLIPIYREANSYPHLVDAGIEGNPDNLSVKELHSKAWTILQPRFQNERIKEATRFMDLASSESASNNLGNIVPAAAHGRVETLFVALGLELWGTFDAQTSEVLLHEKHEPGDQDLLDFAAVQTLLKGGTVYAVEPDQVPGNENAAAIFRYQVS